MDSIKKVTGPCVILAGAGTGKTYTIVEKLKYLIQNNIYPSEKIICITFSNEAANNLSLRVDRLLGNLDASKKPIIRTFHGFSADLLRKYGEKIGINKEFKILDPDQAKVILHRNLKVGPGDCHKYIATIGTAKDLGIKLEEFQEYLASELEFFGGIDLVKRLENLQFELQTLYLKDDGKKKKNLVSEIKKLKTIVDIKKFITVWNSYEKLKVKGNYQDYSDLNVKALELINRNPEISGDYDYLIIDEFQDTNKVQLDFAVSLANHGNITVVGDLNQSIYRFRGAYKENMNLFKEAFKVKSSDIFNLDKSYRSPNSVLKVAHTLIAKNYQNPAECFFVDNVHNRQGSPVEVYELKDSKEEARKIVEIIKEASESGTSLEEICVMFRSHQYGRIIKRALESANIPYSSVAKASLLKQKSIKTAYDYLSILDKLKTKESGGEQAWWDLVYHSDFSREDLILIGKLIKESIPKKKDNDSEDRLLSVYLFNNLNKFKLSESGKISAQSLIDKLKMMIGSMQKPVAELLQDIYNISGLMNAQRTREEREIMLNLNKFVELAKTHEELYDSDLSNFLYYLQVLENLGIEIEASQLEEAGVRLMTSHATKGLEYKIVIITNMAQKRFPVERYISNPLIPTELLPEVKNELKGLSDEEKLNFLISYERHNQLLEERRLAYVSFTRAKERLILTFADDYGGKPFEPSVFLNEISYKNNKDIVLVIDKEQKYIEAEVELRPASQFSHLVGSQNFDEMLVNLVDNVEKKNVKKEDHKKFSPSALMLFDDCQKEFEYKYVYNMPERKTISWDAMRLGSFVHLVLEKGVSKCFNSIDDFLELARGMAMEDDWKTVEIGEAEVLIRVFFERHKGKYNEETKTEQYLPLKIDDLEFMGYADRIDFTEKGVEIVDYKTDKSAISPRDRNWQLGFYALAAKNKYGEVRKVILDMLRQDKPLEFEIDDKGNATCLSSSRMDGFNIYEVEQELIKTAKSIQEAYVKGFKPCPIEKNCDFCNEYVYRL